ncbi:unnamed protein product [Gongylonema pulchrum]|uniref:39S ribosomal protein L22, mitochondrial n=1 Tax=Gongylonema pulchrum TaxID=637853 RepID=A0A183E939_9BILA|nr:unnamed protein product [Gongylonema pulchrum]
MSGFTELHRDFAMATVKRIDPWQLYEPPIKKRNTYPEYPLLNIQLDAMDFVPLEKFHTYAYKKACQFGFRVVGSYAIPPTKTSLMPDDQRKRVKETAHIPIGVTMMIKKYEQADEDIRYIPDEILEARKAELLSLDDPKTRKLLGWE